MNMAIRDEVRYSDTTGTADVMPDRMASDIERERQSSARLMDSFAASLRKNLPSKDEARDMLRTAGEKVQNAAHYVQDEYLKDMSSGVERFARRRPGVSIGTAVLVGFLLGRALRRR
jgi:ElaB/YqjD/DUF883 family membrane-anchored ribosome-binding protein